MSAMIGIVGTGMRSLSYVLGGVVLALTGAVALTSWQAGQIAAWALDVFGISFVVMLTALILATVFSALRMAAARDKGTQNLWHETGQHAANGVATLALTYTLLGISLGIGSLAEQDLNPETVNTVIRGLTEHFSLAFLTTVVGLPTAAVLRALVSIGAAQVARASQPLIQGNPS